MRSGQTPKTACETALQPILHKEPDTKVALICLNVQGEFGAASVGFDPFLYTVRNQALHTNQVYSVQALHP